MKRLLLLFVTALLLVGTLVPPAAAQQGAVGCEGLLPDVEFATTAAAGPVTVRGADLNQATTERFARDFSGTIATIEQMTPGALDGVEVCIFADRLPLDDEALGWPIGIVLRAAAFRSQGVIVLSAWQPALVPDAGRVGLAHTAQWRVADGAYPATFGIEVAGWHVSVANDELARWENLYLRQMIGETEPWPPIGWELGTLPNTLLWNPESGYANVEGGGQIRLTGAGVFAEFAIESDPGIVANPDPIRLQELDEAWRNDLFDRSGSVRGGTRGWITGAIVGGLIILAAVGLFWQGRVYRRRLERQLRDLTASPPVPAAAVTDPDEAVRPSMGQGLRRGDPGIRRRVPRAVGVDEDDRDRSPARGIIGRLRDRMSSRSEAEDDAFRHPGFDRDD
jgi:hypothetical protein